MRQLHHVTEETREWVRKNIVDADLMAWRDQRSRLPSLREFWVIDVATGELFHKHERTFIRL